MKKLSTLWWVGALALLAGCDPYKDSITAAPSVVTAFVTIGDEGSAADSVVGTGTAGDWAIGTEAAPVPSGSSVIFVKFNKLMDGTKIQASATSCAPASEITVNGVVNPAGWFTCYGPASGQPEEGSSLVIYQGTDIVPGVGGSGWFLQADMAAGTYAISYTATDKDGRELPLNLTVVVADPV